MARKERIVLLGGTTEASSLARAFADRDQFEVVYSLAGVTRNPVLPEKAMTHIGGFGGVSGMVSWLTENRIDRLIDATHPFAQQITVNAYQATQICQIPFLRVERPAWEKKAGDQWIEVFAWKDAVKSLGNQPRNVFLTIGRKELLAFKRCDVKHHYWIRSVDCPDDVFLPEHSEVIIGKGPFNVIDEYDFLRKNHIEYLVSKNSGGKAVYAKIQAARILEIPVILLQRPKSMNIPCVHEWQEVLDWICK